MGSEDLNQSQGHQAAPFKDTGRKPGSLKEAYKDAIAFW